VQLARKQVGEPVNAQAEGNRLEQSGPRLYRQGTRPVLRGTFWPFTDRSGYLFAAGFKPRLGTYDGWEVPAPLKIDIQQGDADLELVARDILGLTKLNYNACTLGDSQPVTIGFSDAVGEILVSNPTIAARRQDIDYRFRYYI
jgi:argonaute-like protein implicated in RNA metabolism and viral defense